MKASKNDIKKIARIIDRVGMRHDQAIIDEEIYNNSLRGAIRSWDVQKEVIDQNRDNIAKVRNRIKNDLEQALKPFSDLIENISVYHGDKNYFDVVITFSEASKPKKKAKKKAKKATSKKSLSNKAIVYKAWKKGNKNQISLHELVDKKVKLSTINSWMSAWRRGKNLPSIAK